MRIQRRQLLSSFLAETFIYTIYILHTTSTTSSLVENKNFDFMVYKSNNSNNHKHNSDSHFSNLSKKIYASYLQFTMSTTSSWV